MKRFWRRICRALQRLWWRVGYGHKGSIVSWTDPEGNIWVGFECCCLEIHGMHQAHVSMPTQTTEIW